MDRIDIHVNVEFVDHAKLLVSTEEKDAVVRQRVLQARLIQSKRYGSSSHLNASMTNQEIKQLAKITKPAQQILNSAAGRLSISARSYMRVVKIARTIADLEGAASIETAHISEALQYRPQNLQSLELA